MMTPFANDTPLKIATWRMRPAPADACGKGVLIKRASVKDGRIVLPDGMSNRMLVLAGGDRMTMAAAREFAPQLNADLPIFQTLAEPWNLAFQPGRGTGIDHASAARAVERTP